MTEQSGGELPHAAPMSLPASLKGPLDLDFAAGACRLAHAAYSTFETDDGAALRTLLAPGGFELLRIYHWRAEEMEASSRPKRDLGLQAYLCACPAFAALVFRGTTDATDWIANLRLRKRRVELNGKRVKAHAGFYAAYAQQAAAIEADAAEAAAGRPLVIVGHSLGGALAQIASAAIGPHLCITFGAPRISNAAFEKCMRAPHFRFENAWDVVPAVPFAALNYFHVGRASHLKADPPDSRARPGSRSQLRTLWINIRSLFGMAVGRDWIGVAHHDLVSYRQRLEAAAARRRR